MDTTPYPKFKAWPAWKAVVERCKAVVRRKNVDSVYAIQADKDRIAVLEGQLRRLRETIKERCPHTLGHLVVEEYSKTDTRGCFVNESDRTIRCTLCDQQLDSWTER